MVKLLNAHKHRHREQAIRGCLRLGPTGTQFGSGALTSPDANSKTAGVQSEPKSIPCRMQNMERLAVGGIPTARQEQQVQPGEDRRSQRQRVMRRICPRRSGLEWQKSMWNRLKPGKANDERRPSLGASWSCRPKEHSADGRIPVLPSYPRGVRCTTMHLTYRVMEHPTTGMFLARLEPCEGKLSRPVLRGA